MVQQADVLIENFKVGTMARLGLGYDDLRQINPGLIYCAITGYGQSGPYHERPGYDTVIQAQGGVMSITGPAEDEPFKVGVAIVDVTAGMHAVISILAALHHRARSGQGQFIDIALFDAQLGWLVNVAGSYLVSGESPARYGNAHATIVPYQTFATADGHLMLAVGNDRQFASLCGVLGKPAWIEDARFVTNPARVAHRGVDSPAGGGIRPGAHARVDRASTRRGRTMWAGERRADGAFRSPGRGEGDGAICGRQPGRNDPVGGSGGEDDRDAVAGCQRAALPGRTHRGCPTQAAWYVGGRNWCFAGRRCGVGDMR
ncbi:MAG: CaiB/BaiF CoA-transferase family protein [Caldilineaceae bacterium]